MGWVGIVVTGATARMLVDAKTRLAEPMSAATASMLDNVVRAPASSSAGRAPFSAAAAEALELLGTDPLRPTGAVRDALAAGRLVRTGAPEVLDHTEHVLRSGPIDVSARTPVGGGINGMLFRVGIADDTVAGAPKLQAVEKSASAQAAQEELGWKLARTLGIDHIVPPVARRADGVARIEFRSGDSLSKAGIQTTQDLDEALTASYLDDAALALSPTEAAQAARIDRQLLQTFDYLLANNDRHLGNALYDAARGQLSFIDSGHAGRGAVRNIGTALEPSLRGFQAGTHGGRVQLDPAVVEYLRARVTPDDLRAVHASVFEQSGIAGPQFGSIGAKFIDEVRSPMFREDMVRRLQQVLDTGGYTHRAYAAEQLVEMDLGFHRNPQGLAAVKGQFRMGFDGF